MTNKQILNITAYALIFVLGVVGGTIAVFLDPDIPTWQDWALSIAPMGSIFYGADGIRRTVKARKG